VYAAITTMRLDLTGPAARDVPALLRDLVGRTCPAALAVGMLDATLLHLPARQPPVRLPAMRPARDHGQIRVALLLRLVDPVVCAAEPGARIVVRWVERTRARERLDRAEVVPFHGEHGAEIAEALPAGAISTKRFAFSSSSGPRLACARPVCEPLPIAAISVRICHVPKHQDAA